MPENETKICDNCYAEVGKSETVCPKCGTNFAELDELVNTIEQGNAISEKRKKRNAPPAPVPESVKTPAQQLS